MLFSVIRKRANIWLKMMLTEIENCKYENKQTRDEHKKRENEKSIYPRSLRTVSIGIWLRKLGMISTIGVSRYISRAESRVVWCTRATVNGYIVLRDSQSNEKKVTASQKSKPNVSVCCIDFVSRKTAVQSSSNFFRSNAKSNRFSNFPSNISIFHSSPVFSLVFLATQLLYSVN